MLMLISFVVSVSEVQNPAGIRCCMQTFQLNTVSLSVQVETGLSSNCSFYKFILISQNDQTEFGCGF